MTKQRAIFLLCGLLFFSGFAFMFYHENASSPEDKKAEVQAIREQYQKNNPDWNPNDEDGGPNDEKGGPGNYEGGPNTDDDTDDSGPNTDDD